MEKRNKLSSVFTRLLLLFLSIVFFSTFMLHNNSPKKIYGNNRESIIESIKSNPIIEDKNDFEIVDIVDADENTKIVGFFSNGGTGVASFIKNKDNNYEMKEIKTQGNTKTAYFNVISRDIEDKKFVVVSNGDGLDKVTLKINNKYNQSKDNLINKPSVTIFDLEYPEKESKSLAIEVRFLGPNGDEFNFSNDL
jgi:hypothetical protein